MKYTIVWNQNKTEGIILSGEDAPAEADHACNIENYLHQGVSSLADYFRENYGEYQDCTTQNGLAPLQPTDEMMKAGRYALDLCMVNGLPAGQIVISIWQEMAKELNK